MVRPTVRRLLLAMLVGALPSALHASDAADQPRDLRLFDKPLAIEDVRTPSSAADARPAGSLSCFYFADHVVKVFRSGTPEGDTAIGLVPIWQGAARIPCQAGREPNELTLPLHREVFVGAKGRFVETEAADPNGAVPFALFDRRSGQRRFRDTMSASGLHFIADEGGTLHLRYTRAVEGSCSILKEGQPCWVRIMRESRTPGVVSNWPAPVEACAAAYRGRAPADDPSIATYDVEVTVSPFAALHVLDRSAPGCEPLP